MSDSISQPRRRWAFPVEHSGESTAVNVNYRGMQADPCKARRSRIACMGHQVPNASQAGKQAGMHRHVRMSRGVVTTRIEGEQVSAAATTTTK